MTIYIQSSRIEVWFIDGKNVLNQVLILTFYFLLLGNNEATLLRVPLSQLQWTSLHCGVEIPITASHLYAIILTKFWCYFFFIVSAEILKESHFNNTSLLFWWIGRFYSSYFGLFGFVSMYNFWGFTNLCFILLHCINVGFSISL